MNPWICVSERLPDDDVEVIVTHLWHGKPTVCAAALMEQFDPDDERQWRSGDWAIGPVVAWMPLPPPMETT